MVKTYSPFNKGTYFWINQGYGGSFSHKNNYGEIRYGLDFDAADNTEIISATDGKVVFAGWSKQDFGYAVIIEHEDGYDIYAHLKSITAEEGAIIKRGSSIGVIGTTGESTGVHLHWERFSEMYEYGRVNTYTSKPTIFTGALEGYNLEGDVIISSSNPIQSKNDPIQPVIVGTKNFYDMNNDGKDDITFFRNSDGRTVSRNGGMYRGSHDSIVHGYFDNNLEFNGILDLNDDGNMDLSMRDYRGGSRRHDIHVSLQNMPFFSPSMFKTGRKVRGWSYLTTLHNDNGPDKIIYSAPNGDNDTKYFADMLNMGARDKFTGQHLGNTRGSDYIGKADINGDGREDILTRYSNGHVVVRYDGREATREALELVDNSFLFAGAGNFDTRSTSDEIAMLNPETRELRIYNSKMTGYSHRFLDERVTEIVGVGNMDGRGGDDILAIYDNINLIAFKNGGTQIHNLTDLPGSEWEIV